MIKLKVVIFLLIGTFAISCGRSSYPCPDLSDAATRGNANALPSHKVKNDKKGLVKKKGVKKAKRR